MALPHFTYLFFCSWRFGLFSILSYQTVLPGTFCQLQWKLHAGRDFVCFVWSCLLRHSRCLGQWRAHGDANKYLRNEWILVPFPWRTCTRFAPGRLCSKYGPGTLSGALWGQNYFRKITKTLLALFTVIFHEFMYFSRNDDIITLTANQVYTCVFLCFENASFNFQFGKYW